MSIHVGNLNLTTTSSIVSGAEQTQVSNEIFAAAASTTSNVSPTPTTQFQNGQPQVSQNNLLPGATQAILMANNMAGFNVDVSNKVSSLIGQINNAAAVSNLAPVFPTPNAIRVSEAQATRFIRKEGI